MIRQATASDAGGCRTIYAPIVRDTTLSYETEPPTAEEMRRRIETTLPQLPWLVDERGGDIAGFTYAAPFRSRLAYRWTVEVSLYIHEAHRRLGVGRGLYTALLDTLRRQGYRTALAVISLPNPPSVALHEDLGFTPVGVFHSAGFKFGSWLDSGWWELSLQSFEGTPPPPRPVSDAWTDPPSHNGPIRV